MNTGEGLHRFVDPVDGEVYLYTQFEVADSRRMFAVFEQPDLKATLRLHRDRARPLAGRLQRPDARAGPRRRGRRRAERHLGLPPDAADLLLRHRARRRPLRRACATRSRPRGGTVPLGIFCRKSLPEHLDADNIFDCTKRGFAFFENEFDRAYPFEKYDQLFTPEYNVGAMENAGAVTFTEIYVFRAKVTEAIVERRALTILHELAHMWFGDLVTMRWWNDLWLNESFAEWASTTAQAEATRVDQRLDDVRHLREGLGLPPGPALLDPPDRRRHPRPRATSRSTSTASPTPRAPRCSSSSSPTSVASRSSPGCAPTSPSTPGATPRSPTCSPSWS